MRLPVPPILRPAIFSFQSDNLMALANASLLSLCYRIVAATTQNANKHLTPVPLRLLQSPLLYFHTSSSSRWDICCISLVCNSV